MGKDIQGRYEVKSPVDLQSEEKRLVYLLGQIKDLGSPLTISASDSHLVNDPDKSFSLRFANMISLHEERDVKIVIWTLKESFPLNKSSKETEIVVEMNEQQVKNIKMKFNFDTKNGRKAGEYKDTIKSNWIMVLVVLNNTIVQLLEQAKHC